jgi:cytoskeletal protein CcmA (bactofilin family)
MTDKDITQRPNYFAGQYLLEDDFELEQNYHIDRLQRHNRLLHVSGIAEGLSVTKVQGLKIRVSPGTAVDKQGKQIILHTERTMDLPVNGENTLFIKYVEKKDSLQEGTTDGYRRIVEEPAINFTASESSIALAKLTVTGREINIDESVRQYSGLRLPGAKNSEVTLRSHGNENRNLAELSGSLSISGTLAVTGESTLTGNVKANGSLTVNNKGSGRIAEFIQGGSGDGVYISGVKGENSALNIADNETENPTLVVANKGSGFIAGFTQEGSGNGVYIIGVKGENSALDILDNVPENSTLVVANNGSGFLAAFARQGSGKGVYIGGVEGENTALSIADNKTEDPTLVVANKGSGRIAEFTQEGLGDGVYISGVSGENNALYIANNGTEKSTLVVENEGNGTTLDVRQHGTGKAAEFKGKVTADGDAELTGNLTVKGQTQLNKSLKILENTTLEKNMSVKGKLTTMEGSIGIGTDTPKSQLEIRKDNKGGLGPVLTLSNNLGYANAGAAIDFNGYDVENYDPTARLRSLDDNHSSHLVFYTKAPGSRNNTLQERLRITHDGKVGIGTAEPKEKLHVEGNLYVKGNIYTEGRYWVGNRLWKEDPWLQLELRDHHVAGWGSRSETYPSDLRLKTDIVPIANALDTIEQLNPVSFKWADINYFLKKIENAMLESPLQHEQYSEAMEELSQRIKIKLEKPQVGFLAQDVERVFSDWVEEDVDGYKRINMTQLNALIVQAIKEIKAIQQKTTKEIYELQDKVTIIEKRKD